MDDTSLESLSASQLRALAKQQTTRIEELKAFSVAHTKAQEDIIKLKGAASKLMAQRNEYRDRATKLSEQLSHLQSSDVSSTITIDSSSTSQDAPSFEEPTPRTTQLIHSIPEESQTLLPSPPAAISSKIQFLEKENEAKSVLITDLEKQIKELRALPSQANMHQPNSSDVAGTQLLASLREEKEALLNENNQLKMQKQQLLLRIDSNNEKARQLKANVEEVKSRLAEKEKKLIAVKRRLDEREVDLARREKALLRTQQTQQTHELSLSHQDIAMTSINTSLSPLNSSFSPTKEMSFLSNDLSSLFSPTDNADGGTDTSNNNGNRDHNTAKETLSPNTSINASAFISEYEVNANPSLPQSQDLESSPHANLVRQYEELQQQHNILISRQNHLTDEKASLLEELERLRAGSDSAAKESEEMVEIVKERDLLRTSLVTMQTDSLALCTKLQDAQKVTEVRLHELEKERLELQNESALLREESLRWKSVAEKSSIDRAEQGNAEKARLELQHQTVLSKLMDAEMLSSQLQTQVVVLEREVSVKCGQIVELEEKLNEQMEINTEREDNTRRVEKVTLKLQETEEKLQRVVEQSQQVKQSQQLQLQQAQVLETQRSESEITTRTLQEQVEFLVQENRTISSLLEVLSQTQNLAFSEALKNRQEEIFRQLQQERELLQLK